MIVAGIAGSIAANVVPHLAHGITGRPFPTPFANPPGVGDSSAVLNLIWATVNAFGAVTLFAGVRHHLDEPRVRASAAVGAVVSGAAVRAYFRSVRRH
ncbi:hypothetical protein GS4_15_00680 [Gordonia soli NBRC 108243]|uniref:Uncharacterized protein n=1 Tax=Gordonia soli NBRC 108243 TaxID=1223545 RepID=M0QIQ4_9ACTN|nr:hypothetical protein GS4_15_00680 [Gordonia soli NBRC 108243]